MLRFAQHDIDKVARIATQPLKGEEVSELTVGDRSIIVSASLHYPLAYSHLFSSGAELAHFTLRGMQLIA